MTTPPASTTTATGRHTRHRSPGRIPSLGRILGGLALLLLALLVGGLAQTEIVLVTSEENGEFPVGSRVLREDDFHHPRLQLLRRREKLDEVVAAGRTQFEKIVLLRSWVRRQWESGGSFYYPPWDAVEILDLARQHGNRGFCAQYAIVFLQACQSLGLHARYVDLPGHFVVGVWSDDHDRWVVMDPMNDIFYERDGVPMRGRDLYRAYWENDPRGIVQVGATGDRRAVTPQDLAAYRLYSIDLSADQLTSPVELTVNGVPRTLALAGDHRTYPRVGRDRLAIMSDFLAWRGREAGESFPERPETTDPDEFRRAYNQTAILLANERMTGGILKVALLAGNSPTYERFLVRSDERGEWVPAPAPRVRWMLQPGMNQLSARIETSFGWRGTESRLRVYYKPALLGSLPSFRGNVVTLLWSRPEG